MVKEITKYASADKILSELRKGKEVVDKIGDYVVLPEELERAKLVREAEVFVENYRKENGTKAYLCERLRDGFIGNLISDNNGNSYIQAVRGKPYGTVVAIPTEDDIVLGMSYMDPDDAKFSHPIVGCYIALKRAIDGKENGKVRAEERFIKNKAKKQIEHFEKRSLAFFWPDKYSHSRGTEPVVYPDYDIIHERRAKILGEEK